MGGLRSAPPEVEFDHCGRQVRATRADGQPFTRYIPCSEGCGYVIGVGDAIESVSHDSCLKRSGEDDGSEAS